MIKQRRKKDKKPLTTFTKSIIIIISVLFVVSASIGGYGYYIFNKSHEVSKQLTAAEIQSLTKYDATDTQVVSTLKANALANNLATGSTDLLVKLKNYEALVKSIETGKLEPSKLDQSLAELKKNFSLSDSQINTLKSAYHKGRLKTLISELDKKLDTYTIENIDGILTIADEIRSTSVDEVKVYLESSTEPYPENLDGSIKVLNKLNGVLDSIIAFNSLFTNPNTISQYTVNSFGDLNSFEKPYQTKYIDLQKYVQTRDAVAEQNKELQNFKDEVEASNKLKENTIPLPNLINMTIKEAKELAKKDGFRLGVVSGYTGADNDIIKTQDADLDTYNLLYKGSVIYVTTIDMNPKPEPSSSSSSSSSSSQSSSSSSSSSYSSSSSTSSSSSSNLHNPDYNFDTNETRSTTAQK